MRNFIVTRTAGLRRVRDGARQTALLLDCPFCKMPSKKSIYFVPLGLTLNASQFLEGLMREFSAEMVGTMLLVLLGDGTVAGVLLNKSKAEKSGWIVITTGWGLAVAMAVYAVGRVSGAHINPAVTLSLAAVGKLPWTAVPAYVLGQFAGAFLGAVLVWLAYLAHWSVTEDKSLKLAVFATAPAIRRMPANVITEAIGTFVLVFGILALGANKAPNDTGLTPLLVGFLVWAVGISLGGPTGYAINPARDLAPRLAHAILPIPNKGGSDWGYSWVPVIGPIAGGIIGAVVYVGCAGLFGQ
jgi:glycerol uptake facilitator protein